MSELSKGKVEQDAKIAQMEQEAATQQGRLDAAEQEAQVPLYYFTSTSTLPLLIYYYMYFTATSTLSLLIYYYGYLLLRLLYHY